MRKTILFMAVLFAMMVLFLWGCTRTVTFGPSAPDLPTPTVTDTPTIVPTATGTETRVYTHTHTLTMTPLSAFTATPTISPTEIFTGTPTGALPTVTYSPTPTRTGCWKTVPNSHELPQNPVSAGVTAAGFRLGLGNLAGICDKTVTFMSFSNTTTGNLASEILEVQLWYETTFVDSVAYGGSFNFTGASLGDMGTYWVKYVLSPAAEGVIETQLTAIDGYVTDSGQSLGWLTSNWQSVTFPIAGAEPLTVVSGSETPTPSFTSTAMRTRTHTFTPSASPTDTPAGADTPTISPTPTVTGTFTSCKTPTRTPTCGITPTPVYFVTGNINYTGTGTVNNVHPLRVDLYYNSRHYTLVNNNGGPYTIGAQYIGWGNLRAYYYYTDYVDFSNTGYGDYSPMPGDRYYGAGPCPGPPTPAEIPVTFTTGISAGPDIVIDDSCTYAGFYGTLTYTGAKAEVGICRRLGMEVYSDAGYTTLFVRTYVQSSGGKYKVITNTTTSGLDPVYLRLWYDANGTTAFDAGDPYLDYGQVIPTSDGLVLDVSFGDAFVM